MPQCAEFDYHTHTCKTCDLKPTGFPVPVTIPTGKHPGTYPAYAKGCNFCTNTLAYGKSGNGFVQHAYFLAHLKHVNKLPKHIICFVNLLAGLYSHMLAVVVACSHISGLDLVGLGFQNSKLQNAL